MLRLLLIVFTLIKSVTVVKAQEETYSNLNLQTSYLYEIPGADLAERYGGNSKFEFKLEYLSTMNYAIYVKGGVRINQNVKEDVFAPIRTEEGFVLGVNGFYADIFGRKRGMDAGLGIDKIWPLQKNFLRTGLSLGYISHWIKVVDDSQSVPQVTGLSGQIYDRFASGMGIEENIQFQYNIERAAFLIGFQLGQFFTTEHRHQIINGAEERRLDLYFGTKITYLLPLYKFNSEETVYY